MLNPKDIVEMINTPENKKRIELDTIRYSIYNGQLRETIKKAITKEFILPETVLELINRIIPVNITQKIVNKLAQVYREAPQREAANGLETDTEALDFYVEKLKVNRKFKWANRLFKLHKHDLWEPYLDSQGIPKVRVLPSQTYTLLSDDPIEPNRPTIVVKHLSWGNGVNSESKHVVWTDQFHYVMNGEGVILTDEMIAMNNPEGINPMGELPFTYVRENDDLLIPMSDDDLISMQIAICLLLTDLAFATKYQAWSIIWLKNVATEKLSFNPNSVISLNSTPGGDQPEIGTIKPELDSDAMLRQVEALVALLLTTKSLSVGSVSGKLDTNTAASGVAKLLDEAETTEDRKDQIAYFEEAEKTFWNKFAQKILPYWISTGAIDPECVMPFSSDFELKITFQDAKPMISDRERIEIEKLKLDADLTTKMDAIKSINPGMSDENAKNLILEIRKEEMESQKFFQRNLVDQQNGALDNGSDQA